MTDFNAVLAPIRPLTVIIGKVVLILGVLKFFGLNIPVNGGGLELAAIGWLITTI